MHRLPDLHWTLLLLQSKWAEFFPTIVTTARTVDVLVNGMAGRSESLVLVRSDHQFH
jgi:hypothetical protein